MLSRTLSKLRAREQVTIVALGDSITETTFHTRGHMNWLGLLDEALFETYGNGGRAIINSGKCASSAEESLTRLESDVLRFDPDLVIISLGMNDAGRGMGYLETFKEQIRTIIRTVRDRCGSEILLRTPNPVVLTNGQPLPPEQPNPGKPWESPERPLTDYAAALVGIAEEMGCEVVDHHTLWCSKQFHAPVPVADPTGLWPRMADAIHPGYLGHLIFFREIAHLFEVPEYFPWEGVGDREVASCELRVGKTAEIAILRREPPSHTRHPEREAVEG